METVQGYGIGIDGCKRLSRGHTSLWEQEGLLLSCRGFWLFSDRLIGGRDGGGLSTTLSLGLRSGGLESKFGQGPGHPGQESDGLSYLCLGYKRGMCLRGTQLGTLIRESPGNPVRLVCGLAL